ncbi:hypothetical protein Theco_1951 [Thermobacillus composti KWC4]|jgi:hypothetical protein|uniref:Uncharacterized protein n=1 Tax=Thermobacillus composti (strain DSM 18247 / JCM 13945 / KWC4) TaxID=717605 RepID=L0ECS0_THECK|nr:hypothetical protein Theco_1951 [Thermobacillus composti KWC4]
MNGTMKPAGSHSRPAFVYPRGIFYERERISCRMNMT